MKPANKMKFLTVIIALLALGGVFLLQRHTAEKSPEPEKPSSSSQKTANNTGPLQVVSPESAKPPEETPLQAARPVMNQQQGLETTNITPELELPDAFHDSEIVMITARAEMAQIWKAQDKIRATWPSYSDVRELLRKKLLTKLDFDNLSDEKLLQIAIEFRENFWKAGGCLSGTSYRDAYLARILLEYAHERNPKNLAMTDELVETIQSTGIMQGKNPDKRALNNRFAEVILKLRGEQFEQLKTEVERGRMPIWDDFVRANDLVILLGESGDFESGLDVTKWLIRQAGRGGWSAYLQPIERLQHNLKNNRASAFDIYAPAKLEFPEEFRYARRLPSFKGPDPEKRGLTPVHLLRPYPVWE